MNSSCHCIFIWCLVILAIKGSFIPISINEGENKPEVTQTKNTSTTQSVNWDEDQSRWDSEIEVINPTYLSISSNVSVDNPHSEPLVAAIDFGRNNFDENGNNVEENDEVKDDRKEFFSYLYGDKILTAKKPNKNRRRRIKGNSNTSKNSRNKAKAKGPTSDVKKRTKLKKDKRAKIKVKQPEGIISDLKWSSEERSEIKNESVNRSDIKNEEHLKNHRLSSYDDSYHSAKYDEWPDIYNMFQDIETSGFQFDPGLFVDPYANQITNFNERIDEDADDYDENAYDYKDFYFDRIDQGNNAKDYGDDYDYIPANTFMDLTKDPENQDEFIPSIQIDPLFIPSPKIPFNADKNLLSQAIQYTEKPKSEAGIRRPISPWKLTFPFPPSFSSSISQVSSNFIANQGVVKPTVNPQISTNKLPSPTIYSKQNQGQNSAFVVSTIHATHPSRKPNLKGLFADPIQNKIRQNNIPPPPLPPIKPKPKRRRVDFKRGFDRLKKLIRSIKLKRRRRFRKLRKGDGKRRKRKLVKSDLLKSSISPYLIAPGLRHSSNRFKIKGRRRLRRKNPIGQRRNEDDENESSTTAIKVSPRSMAYKMLDGLNRAARLSSEMIFYLTFFALAN